MAVLKPSGSGDFQLIDENEVVNVILTAVDPNEFEWDGETVYKLRWVFSITDQGPWLGKDIQGDTSQKFTAHPNCKAYNWSAAILGKNPPTDRDFDTDDLLGLPCRVLVGHRTDKQGRVWMEVKEVMSPRPGTAATTPTTPTGEAPF